MANDITFIVHKEWLDAIAALPIDKQDAVIGDLIRYGVELSPAHEDDPMITAMVNLVKGRIDYSKDKYNNKIEASKSAGRKKKTTEEQVYTLAQKYTKSQEIANILGVSTSTVEHNNGWRFRGNKEVQFDNEGNILLKNE